MGTKHYVAIALMTWGAIGVMNQFFNIQALTSGSAPTAALNSFDPATVFSIANPSGAGYTSPAMLTDVAILAGGAYLFWK